MFKRKDSSSKSCEVKSINAQARGGVARSSDEVSVMEMEQRGCIIWLCVYINLNKREGVYRYDKSIFHCQGIGVGGI